MLLKNMMDEKHKNVISAKPSMTTREAVELLVSNNIGCLPVLDEDESLIGILSERDIMTKVNEAINQLPSLTVENIMTKKPICGSPDDSLTTIAEIMEKNSIRHLPIVRDDKVIGLVSLWEIYRTRMINMEQENRTLSHMLDGRDKSGDYDTVRRDSDG